MNEKRVVITGLGVICSIATGKEAFFEAVFKGASGVRPVSLFDTSSYNVKKAAEVVDFEPQNILGPKGLRVMDRCAKLVNCAAKLCLDDASLIVTDENSCDIGVAIGATLGGIKSMSDFDAEALKEGPQYVNPALFPNTVINSPASQISIRFNIKGFNATISTGFSSGLESFVYAANFIKQGRVKAALAGGVEEFCEQFFLGFYRTKYLAGQNPDTLEVSCPFDSRRNGVILGEGASVVMLEDLDSALSRGARIYGEIKGFGAAYSAYRIGKFEPLAKGLKVSMQSALDKSGLVPGDIDYVCSGANSTVDADRLETKAIKDVFKDCAKRLPVSALKSMLGECFSASGALQVASSVASLERQSIAATINYLKKDKECDLDYVANSARNAKVRNILVNSFGPSGCNASAVISKYAG